MASNLSDLKSKVYKLYVDILVPVVPLHFVIPSHFVINLYTLCNPWCTL